jgi:hypothetical protein
MDSQLPATPQKLSAQARYERYCTALLVRGFLEWIEDVDAEPEVLEDLVNSYREEDLDSEDDRDLEQQVASDSGSEDQEDDDFEARFAEESKFLLSITAYSLVCECVILIFGAGFI